MTKGLRCCLGLNVKQTYWDNGCITNILTGQRCFDLYSIRQVDLLKWLVSVRAIYYMNSIKKHTIYFMKYAHTGRE